jgi:hypothetical protein
VVPPNVLALKSKEQAEELAKLTESELIARIAIPADTTGGITEVRQIELEMQRRNIVAGRELKAATDAWSRWLTRLTIAIVGLTAVLVVVGLAPIWR